MERGTQNMHVLAGMGPEQASKGGETVQPPSGGASLYAGEAWFFLGSSMGQRSFGFKMLRSAKGFIYAQSSRDKEQAACFGDALKRSIKASPNSAADVP